MLKMSSFTSYRELVYNHLHWKVPMGVPPLSGVKVISLDSSNGRWGFQSVRILKMSTSIRHKVQAMKRTVSSEYRV